MNHEQAFKEISIENCPHRNHYDNGNSVYCQKKYSKRCKEHTFQIGYNTPSV